MRRGNKVFAPYACSTAVHFFAKRAADVSLDSCADHIIDWHLLVIHTTRYFFAGAYLPPEEIAFIWHCHVDTLHRRLPCQVLKLFLQTSNPVGKVELEWVVQK